MAERETIASNLGHEDALLAFGASVASASSITDLAPSAHASARHAARKRSIRFCAVATASRDELVRLAPSTATLTITHNTATSAKPLPLERRLIAVINHAPRFAR
jgi:hypothetical protein